MKNTYRITIMDSKNAHVAYRILASTLSSAIAAAQKQAGVTTDPTSTSCDGPLDLEAE